MKRKICMKNNKNKGITLIALVITIIVLLILAGVSISMLVGENGILTQAGGMKIKDAHGTVEEGILLEYGDYKIDVATKKEGKTFLDLLKSKGIIDENGVIYIQKLLGKKLGIGKGTGNTDVYKVESKGKYYVLNYYGEDGIAIELEKINETAVEPENPDDWEYVVESDGYISIKKYLGDATVVVIPNMIEGVEVKRIGTTSTSLWDRPITKGSHAYDYPQETITKIIISEGIEEIGSYSFICSEALTEVVIADSLISIGECAFEGCKSLKSVTIPNSVTSIGAYAFKGCTSLNNITIPNSVTSIGKYGFEGCKSLNNLVIPNSVTTIGEGTFKECTSLTNIKISESLNEIAFITFSGCTSLRDITIPGNVTKISSNAFKGCTSLNNIIIPNNVTEISYYVFEECTSLRNITIPSSVAKVSYNVFYNCNPNITVTVGWKENEKPTNWDANWAKYNSAGDDLVTKNRVVYATAN